MSANLPVAVGDEVDADLLNEISGISDSASYYLGASLSPLTSSAATEASILTGSYTFTSGYAYEITVACRFALSGLTSTATVEGRVAFSVRRTNATGTSFWNGASMNVVDTNTYQFHSSTVVKCTTGDTTQTLSFNGQFFAGGGTSALNISVNSNVSPARMTVRRIGLAANHSGALEVPTA